MGRCTKCLALLTLVLGIGIYFLLHNQEITEPLNVPDKYWGKDSARAENDGSGSMEVFRVTVEPSEIEGLKSQLRQTKLTKPLEDAKFEYGMNTRYLVKVIDYWINKYDWQKEEDRINSFPQYLMRIDGIKVHYVHVTPKANGKKVVPLMLVHGWPGSVMEFYKAITILTAPRKDLDFVFEVICPSIPGYGFSEAPRKKGFNAIHAAKMFDKLMKNLGHKKYYLQGGDWGSFITSIMSIMKPESVLGLHLNMITSLDDPIATIRGVIGQYIPPLMPGRDIYDGNTDSLSTIFGEVLKQSGYLHIQATKPDTVGVGLLNSPAGLAAYILEKFSGWTDTEVSENSEDGALEEHFTLDELLTNVMVYWITDSITPSMRFYKENFATEIQNIDMKRRPNKTPSGFLLCDKELFRGQAHLGRERHHNLLSIHQEKCGHFAAMQKPKEFSNSVQMFVRDAEKFHQSSKEKKKK